MRGNLSRRVKVRTSTSWRPSAPLTPECVLQSYANLVSHPRAIAPSSSRLVYRDSSSRIVSYTPATTREQKGVAERRNDGTMATAIWPFDIIDCPLSFPSFWNRRPIDRRRREQPRSLTDHRANLFLRWHWNVYDGSLLTRGNVREPESRLRTVLNKRKLAARPRDSRLTATGSYWWT